MANITMKGMTIHTSGGIPREGSFAPSIRLTKNDLSDATYADYAGKRKVLNIFPSVDTATCAASVRRFNKEASSLSNTVVLNISQDLPFAQKRFCAAEGLNNVETLSGFRSSFAKDFGLDITDGPLRGLCSRVVIVLDANNRVLFSEQVTEITNEPNYEAALAVLK